MSNNYTAKDAHEASSLLAALQKMRCDSAHYIGQSTCPRCLSTVHDALAAAIAVVRAEGRREALEAAAELADAHALFHGHENVLSSEIRALAKEGR